MYCYELLQVVFFFFFLPWQPCHISFPHIGSCCIHLPHFLIPSKPHQATFYISLCLSLFLCLIQLSLKILECHVCFHLPRRIIKFKKIRPPLLFKTHNATMSKIWQLLFKRILFSLCKKRGLATFTFICSHDYDFFLQARNGINCNIIVTISLMSRGAWINEWNSRKNSSRDWGFKFKFGQSSALWKVCVVVARHTCLMSKNNMLHRSWSSSWRILFLLLINFLVCETNLLETSEYVIPQTPWSIFCLVLIFWGLGSLFGSFYSKTLKCNALTFFCLFVELSSCRCKFGSPMIYDFKVLLNQSLLECASSVFGFYASFILLIQSIHLHMSFAHLHFCCVEDFSYPSILWT